MAPKLIPKPGDLHDDADDGFVTPDNILDYIADAYDIERDALIAQTSTAPLQYLRHATIWLVDQHTALNQTHIAELFNDTETNILHSIGVVEKLAAKNPAQKRLLDDLIQQIVDHRNKPN